MDTSTLSGAELDLEVAKRDPRCEGLVFEYCSEKGNEHYFAMCAIVEGGPRVTCAIFIPTGGFDQSARLKIRYEYATEYRPSRDWSQGGFIIEREKMEFRYCGFGEYRAIIVSGSAMGESHLIAAMRCYVASKSPIC